jgi:hypothetical protein
VFAAVAAVSLWFSLGITAVTGDDTRQRLVELPPLWVLAAALIAASASVWYRQPSASRLWPLAMTVVTWLPYVPGKVPAAFLLFEGPIEAGLWVIVGLTVIAGSATQSRLTRARPHPGLAPLTAAAIAAVAFGLGAAALRDQLPIGDEPHYLMMTQSLIKDGDLRIENNHRNRDYASFAAFDLPMHYLTRGTDGQIYSVHAPGVSVVVLPAFAVFGYYGGVATVLLCVALASAIAWHAAWMLTARVAASWIAWAAVFLTAPIFLQAVTVFPDAVGALPVSAGVWLLVALEKGRPVGDRTAIAVAVALAALPWLHSRFAILAGGLGLAIALRLLALGWRRVAIFLAVPIISALLWFGFFWWIWGSPSPAAPWGGGIVSRAEWIPRGIAGLLFDPQAGLLVPAPAYLTAFGGWLALMRARPKLAIEIAGIAAVLAASVASYETWWGGQGAPARYLVAGLPLCVAPIAWLASRSRVAARVSTLLVVVSVLMLMPKVYAAGGAFAFNPETGINPLFGWMAPSVSIPSFDLTPTASQLAYVQRSAGSGAASRIALDIPVDESIAPATRALRLGDVRVFFMDLHADPEPTGFWVPANGETTVIMDLADAARGLGVRLRAGPVPTSAEVTVDGQTRRFEFTPRQRHEMAIPPSAAGAWSVTIRAGAGFRPRDYDPKVADSRELGIWVEVF